MKSSPDEVRKMWVPRGYVMKMYGGMVLRRIDCGEEETKKSPKKKGGKEL